MAAMDESDVSISGTSGVSSPPRDGVDVSGPPVVLLCLMVGTLALAVVALFVRMQWQAFRCRRKRKQGE